VNRFRFREQGRTKKGQTCGQLLHSAIHHRVRFGLMPALQDGSEGPATTADLQHQETLH